MSTWYWLLALILALTLAYELSGVVWLWRRFDKLDLSGRFWHWGIAGAFARRIVRDRRRNEGQKKRLLELLKELRLLGRALPDALIVLDSGQRLLWCNRKAREFFALEQGQNGQKLCVLMPDAKLQKWLEQDGSKPLLGLTAKGQNAVQLSLRRALLPPDRALLIARDVSQILALEQVRRDFVANVSHELRTPLTVLRGYLETLEGESDSEFAGIFTEMAGQTARMVRIVEDLLTLARLENEANYGMASEQPIHMAEMLQQVFKDAQGLSKGAHVVKLQGQFPVDVLGDEKDLRSVFSNLVSNAVRYTPAGGQVEIIWQAHDEGAEFAVRDTGIGIPRQHVPRLTERFYRISNSRSRNSGGTGLGLAIVNHVLTQHQAKLVIESEVGRGSRFACVFPRARLVRHTES